MSNEKYGLTISWEVADQITIENLKENLQLLEDELDAHVNEGQYMHEEDVENYRKNIIPALRFIIEYYGGDVDE